MCNLMNASISVRVTGFQVSLKNFDTFPEDDRRRPSRFENLTQSSRMSSKKYKNASLGSQALIPGLK